MYKKNYRSEKLKFILFSEKVHDIYIAEGYHYVLNKGLNTAMKSRKRGIKGYLLEVDRYKAYDENGKWVYKYDWPYINKLHWYSSDPNDPKTMEYYERNPSQRPKDTIGLTGKAKKAAKSFNKIKRGWIEEISSDIQITEADVEYPLKHEKVKEMCHSRTIKFYIRLDVGYSKGRFSKTGIRLCERLVSSNTKLPRIFSS